MKRVFLRVSQRKIFFRTVPAVQPSAWRLLLSLALLAGISLSALAQTRPTRPQPPSGPPRTPTFDELARDRESQERATLRAQHERKRLVAEERLAAWEALREDLPQMRALLEEIEAELQKPDVGSQLSVSLVQMADELEKLARRTRKNIRKL